jgi:hypothetical protein
MFSIHLVVLWIGGERNFSQVMNSLGITYLILLSSRYFSLTSTALIIHQQVK